MIGSASRDEISQSDVPTRVALHDWKSDQRENGLVRSRDIMERGMAISFVVRFVQVHWLCFYAGLALALDQVLLKAERMLSDLNRNREEYKINMEQLFYHAIFSFVFLYTFTYLLIFTYLLTVFIYLLITNSTWNYCRSHAFRTIIVKYYRNSNNNIMWSIFLWLEND